MQTHIKDRRAALSTPNFDATLLHGDCLTLLRTLKSNSVDLVCTDPPYGIGFMNKEWDTFQPAYVGRQMAVDNTSFAKRSQAHKPKNWKLPSHSRAQIAGKYSFAPDAAKEFGKFIEAVGRECLRVMKPGAFFLMCMTPRQDSLARAVVALEDAGFKVSFTSLYWTFASGFPKARNIGKETGDSRLQGAYGGFQPKPAVEVIIVAMKPMTEKTFAAQVRRNGKAVTWLDAVRIPTGDAVCIHDAPAGSFAGGRQGRGSLLNYRPSITGRFPANLLVSDDALDNGRIRNAGKWNRPKGMRPFANDGEPAAYRESQQIDDTGSYSRYFSLDAWAKTFPFLIAAKASKREKNAGLGDFALVRRADRKKVDGTGGNNPRNRTNTPKQNHHPTVKPLKLMSYLITLGSRPGDVVLDPFLGSGTTAVAAKLLDRRFVGIEREREYLDIARARVACVDHD